MRMQVDECAFIVNPYADIHLSQMLRIELYARRLHAVAGEYADLLRQMLRSCFRVRS